MCEEVDRHIKAKYDIRRRIGKGAYGIVWKSIDKRTGEIVALKKIFDAFTNKTDAQRTFREILFLQEFSAHQNVVQLLNVVKANNDKDIYLVFEFMDADLHAVIKAKMLLPVHIQYILHQLFCVIKYIHSGNVIHRDLKPSNVLINTQCFIKLADFGLARSLTNFDQDDGQDFNPAMTDYVATRWYRSPEILLGSRQYTKGVDMWSLGCIMAEMIAGHPLFPGTSTMNQLDQILTALPPPSSQDILSIHSPYAQIVLKQLEHRRRRTLTSLLPQADDIAQDLLARLLKFNPDHRITASSALSHPFVSRFHDLSKEQELNYDVVPTLDDNVQLSIEQYRDKLYHDIVERRARMMSQQQTAQIQEIKQQDVMVVEEEEVNDVEEEDEFLHLQSDKRILRQQASTEQRPIPTQSPIYSHTPQWPHSSSPHLHPHSPPSPPQQRLLSRNDSTIIKPSPVKPHPLMTTMNAFTRVHSSPSIRTKQQQQRQPQYRRQPVNDGYVDLTLTSARILPSTRSTRPRDVNKRVSRGAPSRLAGGTYTQTHGTISNSELTRLAQH